MTTQITSATRQPALVRSTTGQASRALAPSAVPWSTVLPLAAVLSCADGFWRVALRTALGSVERTTAPAASWLRESLVLLPVFVLAVLAALTLAQHRFGPRPRGLASIGGALLMVVAFGTLGGAGVLAASSAYDYRIQAAQIRMLNSMMNNCSSTCENAQLDATLGLQVRAVVLGTLILLITNLVLVGWLVALRGGTLRLACARSDHSRRGLQERVGLLPAVLAGGLIGVAAIHAAVVPQHLEEWTAAGVFFVLMTLAELSLAVAVVLFRRPMVFLACAASSVGSLLLWLFSRTIGIPFGPNPGVAESAGLADVAACALQVLTLVVAVTLLFWRTPIRRSGPSLNVGRLLLVAVVAVTALGVGGSSLSWVTLTAPDDGSHVRTTP